MFCKDCHYNLKAIDSKQCPECGRPFDPDYPKSWSKYSIPQWQVDMLELWAMIDRWPLFAFASVMFLVLLIFANSIVLRIIFGFMLAVQAWNCYRAFFHGSDALKKLDEATR